MLKNGDTVKIVYSRQLLMLDLCELVGRLAMVTKKEAKGVYIIPKSGRLKDTEWYVPYESIVSQETVDRMRSEQIIKRTKL